MLKKILIGFGAAVILVSVIATISAFFSDSPEKKGEDATMLESSQPSEDPSPSETPDKKALFNLDWDKLAEDFKADTSVMQDFVKDAYAGLNDEGRITITAVVDDSTSPDVVLDYADTLLRRLNGVAQYQDSSIASGTKDTFGGLYDVYDVLIGIAPASKTGNQKEWFVFDGIAAGVQGRHKLTLQDAYQ